MSKYIFEAWQLRKYSRRIPCLSLAINEIDLLILHSSYILCINLLKPNYFWLTFCAEYFIVTRSKTRYFGYPADILILWHIQI